MITLYVLVMLFNGTGNAQSSFAVDGIASWAECQRLGAELKKEVLWGKPICKPYRATR